jgi:hypothetical protein
VSPFRNLAKHIKKAASRFQMTAMYLRRHTVPNFTDGTAFRTGDAKSLVTMVFTRWIPKIIFCRLLKC